MNDANMKSSYICTYKRTQIRTNMIVVNYSEFRESLRNLLDRVENDHEILVVKRRKGKGSVLISLDEYNSLMETVHLLSSKANADRIYESMQQMKEGNTVARGLIVKG